MATRKVDKAEWRAYCDRISKALVGKQAEVEVASLTLGSQLAAEWLPLLGIAYDPKDDVFEIALEGLDHLVPKPREFYVDEVATGVASIEIVDSEGFRQIVKLRDPLLLPAAPARG
jgi:hypothetical protein